MLAIYTTQCDIAATPIKAGKGKQDQITIRTAEAGRIISGKGDVPVLDINSAQLTAVFKAGEAVDVTATAGKIVIRKQL
mgnify:CR=1 FL=1